MTRNATLLLIVIDGLPNAGKTTVSRALAKRLGKCICIELDALRHIADCLELQDSIPFTLEDAGALADRWLSRGFHVILNYPLTELEWQEIAKQIQRRCILHKFTLAPRLTTCLADRGGRRLSDFEKNRIAEMYRQRQSGKPFGTEIDTSDMSVDECAALIHEKLGSISR